MTVARRACRPVDMNDEDSCHVGEENGAQPFPAGPHISRERNISRRADDRQNRRMNKYLAANEQLNRTPIALRSAPILMTFATRTSGIIE